MALGILSITTISWASIYSVIWLILISEFSSVKSNINLGDKYLNSRTPLLMTSVTCEVSEECRQRVHFMLSWVKGLPLSVCLMNTRWVWPSWAFQVEHSLRDTKACLRPRVITSHSLSQYLISVFCTGIPFISLQYTRLPHWNASGPTLLTTVVAASATVSAFRKY